MPNLTDLKSTVARLERELAEAKNAFMRASSYEFKFGDNYYYIDEDGGRWVATWRDNVVDHARQEIGNAFHSKEQAEGELRYRKIMAKLRKLARQSGDIGDAWYRITNRCGEWTYVRTNQAFPGCTRFATRESALSAIAEIGEDDLNFVRG